MTNIAESAAERIVREMGVISQGQHKTYNRFRVWFKCFDCEAGFAAHGNTKRCQGCGGTALDKVK